MKQEINLTSSTTARLSEGEPFLVGVNDTLMRLAGVKLGKTR